MTWMFVGPTDGAVHDALRRAHSLDADHGSFEEYRRDAERDCIVGTPDRAAAIIDAYRDAGVQRIFLNHELYDDLDMLHLVASQVMPRFTG